MPLNWTFSTLGCPDHSFEEIAALARSFDIELLELRAVSGRMDLLNVLRESFGNAGEMCSWLGARNLRIQSLDTSARLVGGDESAWRELEDLAAWADAVGCPHLRVFDGGSSTRIIPESEIEAATLKIRQWRDFREHNHLKTDIIIETHNNLVTTASIKRLQTILGDKPVDILWDAHHTWRSGGEDPVYTWRSIRPWVKHVHVKDSRADPGRKSGFAYTHVGEGEFPFLGCIRALEDGGFSGAVSLEWERAWHPGLDPLETALKRLFNLVG